MSLTASPRLLSSSASASAFSRKVSATALLRVTMVSVMRAPVCSSLETTSPPRRLRSSTSESPVERSVMFTSSARAAMVSAMLAAGLGEGVVEGLRAARHDLDGDGGFLREALRDLVEPGAHHLLQAGGEFGELVVHVLGLEIEAGGETVAGRGDGGGGVVAGGLQPVEQGRAALGQRVDHAIAGMAERQRDVLALFGERTGDALRHFVDLVGDQIADRGDVVWRDRDERWRWRCARVRPG